MQAKNKWWLAGLLLVGAALLAWAFAPRPLRVELAEARLGRFEAGIEEDGKTRVVDRYTVSAPLSGRWLRPALREGDTVAAGATLGWMQAGPSGLTDARSRAQLVARAEAAAAALRAGEAAERGAALQLAEAGLAERRSEQLAAQGFVADSQRDTARLARQRAEQQRLSAQAQLAMARHELSQARAALSLGGADSAERLALKAPIAGRVLRLHQASEAVLALGTPLLELGDVARLELVAELLSVDAMQLRPGQPVRIERWGGEGVLAGQVLRVEPGAFTKVSALGVEEQRVEVVVGFGSAAPPPGLGDGYRVQLNIITRSADQALLVPVSAVFPLPGGRAGQHAVYTLAGGRARLVEVALEARNSGLAWVRSGLKPGDLVVVYPPVTLADGVRARAR
ncbi:HlyD family efflux transporter periplasmic adaptor subunit [Paucibacter sp. PLA-PC-4]|uniref:efflux RND transporter periplasmic adaptor subunit n=1 Tax=Paucibacter sp. PLA-PC-4 TaxID=2993655 RepID=UPI00224B35AE|nr:HlyD family efflux transporter periplasmic adaptor subunit [Paucibacter sp. PLA-PC-4]MCX2863625.1 HlyD family efflux transporter periplasmic adaptor subunit [Paucibacter sp. PLA-PC-4]